MRPILSNFIFVRNKMIIIKYKSRITYRGTEQVRQKEEFRDKRNFIDGILIIIYNRKYIALQV